MRSIGPLGPILPAGTWPRLRKLLFDAGFAPHRSHTLINFLNNHPSLEEVEWNLEYPPHEIHLIKRDCIPVVRHLYSSGGGALLRLCPKAAPDDPDRVIENLGSITFSGLLEIKNSIDNSRLRRLELRSFPHVDLLSRTLEAFPALEWLRIPSVDYE